MTKRPKKAAAKRGLKKPAPSRHDIKRAAIMALADKFDRITPDRVWQAARASDHPLHDEFDWDVQRAAESHWRDTAQRLITRYKFVVTHEDRKIIAPYFVSDPRVDYSAYVSTARVATREDLSSRVLQDELVRIEQAINRARALAGALELEDEFEKLLAQLFTIRARLDDIVVDRGTRAGAAPPMAPA